MEIFFCDVCCSRVTDSHLNRGHGVLHADIVVCGSCIEKGDGAALLKEPEPTQTAAPALAGSTVLDTVRDRIVTQEDSEREPLEELVEEAIPEAEAEAETVAPVEAIESDDAIVESVIEEHDDLNVTAATTEAGQDVIASESDNFEVLEDDVAVVTVPSIDVDDSDLDLESSNEDESDLFDGDIDDEKEHVEERLSNSVEAEIEGLDGSHISADDVIDDLDDCTDSEVLDDSEADDDGSHTASYSADERAAIKRLTENEDTVDAVADKSSSQSGRSNSGARRTSQRGSPQRGSPQRGSSQRGSPQRGTSQRKSAVSGRKKSSAVRPSTRKAATSRTTTKKVKLGPGGLPMPLFISMLTIPVMLIIFFFVSQSGSSRPEYEEAARYGATATGMARLIKDARLLAQSGHADQDLVQIKKSLKLIAQLRTQMDDFEAERLADGWDSDAVGRWLKKRKYHNLVGGLAKTLRDDKFLLENQ